MSCYEEENGTLKLPVKSYQTVRRAVVAAQKAQQQKEYDAAMALRNACKAVGIRTGRLKIERGQHKGTSLGSLCDKYSRQYGVEYWAIYVLVSPYSTDKIQNPPKSHLKVKASETYFSFDCASIRFDPKRKTVRWLVEENNRSVDSSRGHHIGQAFWGAIRRVEWTSKTGGSIWYTSEYNREYNRGPNSWDGTFYGGIGKRERKQRYGR